MQVNIIEVKTKIKNVNTYNESSLFINLQDNEPNRNSNRLNKTIDMNKNIIVIWPQKEHTKQSSGY